jgi:hypothetical protein
MYDIKPNLVIGFHGCERAVRDQLLNKPNKIVYSRQPYDWLGHGMYFWENNYTRAFQWAEDKMRRGAIQNPAVIGGVLYLGYCCDFLDAKYIQMLKVHHKAMADYYKAASMEMPQNKDLPQDKYKDKILRELDCAVIERMHEKYSLQAQAEIKEKGFTEGKVFDSTRAVFTEGGPVFEGAGLFEKSHIQICIRNPNCILGFFLPRKEIDFMPGWEKDKHAA